MPLNRVLAKLGVETNGPNLHGGEIGLQLPTIDTKEIDATFPVMHISDEWTCTTKLINIFII